MSLLPLPPGRRPLGPEARAHPPAAESLLARLWPGGKAPPPCSRLRHASAGQGLPPSAVGGKWHRPSAVTQKRHHERPKGEATKQRASEQPIFTQLSFAKACMKIWCSLNRDSANKWRELCALWISFPVAHVTETFLGTLLWDIFLDNQGLYVNFCYSTTGEANGL
jgi:hypothetical protein